MTQLLFPQAVFVGRDLAGNLLGSPRKMISRDEMNLAEFPLTVLSTRVDPTIKTLEFTDTVFSKNGDSIERKWIITGADKFGLPTASDDEVLLGLMKLTVDSGFRDRKVFFSRYELLRILRWTTEGRSYTRLQRALDRLSGVRIKASNAFYDNEAKSHSTRNFGIIDAYEINDGRTVEAKPSYFSWSDVMFKSFQVGFIKKLDLQFYLGLESAVSKRLYRFLDKHFWYKSRLTMNLFVLSHEKIGISRNYQYASSLRQQLDPAFDELIRHGFIASYEYQGRGKGTEITVQSAAAKGRSTLREEGSERTQKPEILSATEVNSKHLGQRGGYSEDNSARNSRSSEAQRTSHSSNDFSGNIFSGNRAKRVGEGTPAMDSGLRDPGTEELPGHGAVTGAVTVESKALTALTARGISTPQASRLTRGRSGASLQRILDIVAYYDRLCSMKSKLVSRSPIGFLYRAVESPESFILPADKNIPGASSQRPAQGALALQQEAHRPDSTLRQQAVSRDAVARDKLAELQASYLEARRRAVQQMKLDVEPGLLSKITQEVEAALAKLRSLISPKRFQETVDHGIEERLVKMFLFPEFDEWIQKQRLGSH